MYNTKPKKLLFFIIHKCPQIPSAWYGKFSLVEKYTEEEEKQEEEDGVCSHYLRLVGVMENGTWYEAVVLKL